MRGSAEIMVSESVMKMAMFYDSLQTFRVKCVLCPNECIIEDGNLGLCRVRKNEKGILYTINFGEITCMAIDPIEKKPLKHWRPGSSIFSIGSYGCNMKCPFCQNFDISQNRPSTSYLSPEEIVEKTIRAKQKAIAYTYNEPTVFYEMMYETAVIARQNEIAGVMVTNGYINVKPLIQILPYIDALNIDVKACDDIGYKGLGVEGIKPVLETIEQAKVYGKHVEITCLMAPYMFDDLNKANNLFDNIYNRVGDIPVHISRYFPRYLSDEPATEIVRMLEMQKIARKYFKYVHLGNV